MRGETVLVDGAAVGNVLVEPGFKKDANEVSLPLGTVAYYTLRFPSDYAGPVEGAKVTVRGLELDSIGYADHWDAARVFDAWANPWDMTVVVGRTLGDFTAHVEIISITVELDALGDAIASEETVYAGDAQARHSYVNESDGAAFDTDIAETWWFVVPWSAAVSALRPESTAIEYDGARYVVRDVVNVNGRSEYMSFEAVRRNIADAASGESGITGA